MADEDDASKTEEPTDKKLGEARNKGQIASSQEVKNLGILLAATAGLMFIAPNLANNVRTTMHPFVQSPHDIPMDFEHLRLVFSELALDLALIMAPVFG